jgi:hypothetical protein
MFNVLDTGIHKQIIGIKQRKKLNLLMNECSFYRWSNKAETALTRKKSRHYLSITESPIFANR